MHGSSESPRGDGLRQSLLLLGVVIAIALVGLAIDGNGPKVLRVGAAAGTYAATLLVLSGTGRGANDWWWFAVAGVLAGVASGLLRPEPGMSSIAIDSGAATVLGTVHWVGLVSSERMRRKITA